MKKFIVIVISFLTILQVPVSGEIRRIKLGGLPQHPRILLLKNEEQSIKRFISSDVCWEKIHETILTESEKLLSVPPIERVMVGRRLLDVSRKALRNIFFLSYSYRLTNDKAYAERAEKELLAVAAFKDWNPSHFLDVGEMTMGVAIGYDWLYDWLSEESKSIVRNAIIEKGIRPSMDDRYNDFITAHNNWSQVCNTGIAYGALAIAEDEPALAEEMLHRSVNNIYMADYAPDGAYPEGAGYWSYGTSYNVMFISALDKAFGTDFGLSGTPGFKQTAEYAQHVIANDYHIFNYSDSDEYGRTGLNTTLFWFARKYDDGTLLWMQKRELERLNKLGGYRLLPALMVWANGIKQRTILPPKKKMFTAQGKSPVCFMRTSWTDKKAIFLGFKLGSPSVSHAHMDIGSFVMVADGVRWACDFGMQQYESLESKGMDIWNREQNSQRWQVFRYNNMAHNTLTFDNQLQRVKGYAKVDRWGESDKLMFAVSDLTDMYRDRVSEVKRGVAIVGEKNQYVVVRDEIEGGKELSTVRWNMLTECRAEMIGDGKAVLVAKNGKRLVLRVDYPKGVKVCTWSTKSPNSWDAGNKNTVFVGFEYKVPAGEKVVLQVSLLPGKKDNGLLYNKELVNW